MTEIALEQLRRLQDSETGKRASAEGVVKRFMAEVKMSPKKWEDYGNALRKQGPSVDIDALVRMQKRIRRKRSERVKP